MFFKKRINKKVLIGVLLFSFILISIILFKKYTNINSNLYIILVRKENYAIIFNGFNKYYLSINKDIDIDVFDILYIKGEYLEIDFVTLESQFDFKEYLFNKGIDYKLNYENIKKIIDLPFNLYEIKNNFLSSFDNIEIREVVGSILFKEVDYDSENLNDIKDAGLFILFSYTTIYINFLFNLIKNLFGYKFDERGSTKYAIIFTLLLSIFNINKFIIINFILFKIITYINKYFFNSFLERIEIISLLGIFYIFVNDRVIFQSSFYISFLLKYFFLFFNTKLNYFPKFKAYFLRKLFLFLLIFPFTLSFYNSINVLSFFLIIFLTPLSKYIYLISLLTFLILPTTYGEIMIDLAYKIIKFFLNSNISIYAPSFNEYLYLIYYLLIFITFMFFEINLKKIYRTLFALLSILITLYFIPINNYFIAKICFINVGQGDSILIKTKNKAYLIDTGGLIYNDIAKNTLIPFFKKEKIYSINSVFITHDDYDHNGALNSLNENFKIDSIYTYNNFSLFNDSSLNIKNLNDYKEKNDENDKSLVLYLEFYKKYFLFMGDASKDIEENILNKYPNLDCDYLKIGHHGSKTSSSYKFLKAVSPTEAIISCGENNRYNHPHKETLQNLSKLNINVRRTDKEGTIVYNFLSF